MRRAAAFTLIEIMLSVLVILIVVLVAVPSIDGVLADSRRRASFEKFNEFVQNARNLSLREQRPYLLAWEQDLSSGFSRTTIVLRPEETPGQDQPAGGDKRMVAGEDETYNLELPAALDPVTRKAWMFWPSGTCEPAVVSYKSPAVTWTATYNPLTGQPAFSMP